MVDEFPQDEIKRSSGGASENILKNLIIIDEFK
jgi:hypothetical protein